MEIELTQGKRMVIDDEDSDLSSYRWYAHKEGRPSCIIYYARRTDNRLGVSFYVHRLILERMIGRKLEKDEFTDHINHDTMDNRRSNLRVVNKAGNAMNRSTRQDAKSSIFKGVSWCANVKRWRARIRVKGKLIYLGCYNDETSAARAYDNASKRLFGEFSNPKFGHEGELSGTTPDMPKHT